jgi:hypothetical protein
MVIHSIKKIIKTNLNRNETPFYFSEGIWAQYFTATLLISSLFLCFFKREIQMFQRVNKVIFILLFSYWAHRICFYSFFDFRSLLDFGNSCDKGINFSGIRICEFIKCFNIEIQMKRELSLLLIFERNFKFCNILCFDWIEIFIVKLIKLIVLGLL